MLPLLLAQLDTLTPSDHAWATAGRVLTVLIAGGAGVGLFTWRAVTSKLFCDLLRQHEGEVKACMDRLYGARTAEMDEAVQQTERNRLHLEQHDDELEGIHAAILEQGKSLSASLSVAVEAQTKAMERIADSSEKGLEKIGRVLDRVARDTATNTTSIAWIEGSMRAPEGQAERRVRPPRRKNDS